nr:MAG TPA: hypothetical protein [Caudoviricetes sp.]
MWSWSLAAGSFLCSLNYLLDNEKDLTLLFGIFSKCSC